MKSKHSLLLPVLSLFAAATFLHSTAVAQDAPVSIEIAKINPGGGAKTRTLAIQHAGRTGRVVVDANPALTMAEIRKITPVTERVKVTSGSTPETREVAALRLQFTPAGREKYSALLSQWKGKQIGIVVDGKLVATPVLESRGGNSELTVSGTFSPDESRLIAARSQADALPPVAEGPAPKASKAKKK